MIVERERVGHAVHSDVIGEIIISINDLQRKHEHHDGIIGELQKSNQELKESNRQNNEVIGELRDCMHLQTNQLQMIINKIGRFEPFISDAGEAVSGLVAIGRIFPRWKSALVFMFGVLVLVSNVAEPMISRLGALIK